MKLNFKSCLRNKGNLVRKDRRRKGRVGKERRGGGGSIAGRIGWDESEKRERAAVAAGMSGRGSTHLAR